jgi:energy-converting hydrogenase Eha subunit A
MQLRDASAAVMGKISSYLLAALMLIIIAAILLTLPCYFLWNWLMPAIFNLPVITLWQALGLTVFCKILFGNYGGKEE